MAHRYNAAEIARMLVIGDRPRSREQIIAEVTSALENAHTTGKLEGRATGREAVLLEALAIAEGDEQSARARVNKLRRELGL